MTQNTGTLDRTIRAVVGLALLAATFTGAIGVWGWIGLVPLVTAIIGWCPPYAILGINTCSMKK